MHRLGKVVPPKREILKNISLSFFPGAKIGVLGLNGSGKSTLLKIMAGVDTEFDGEARPMPDLNIGYLPQEPQLDPEKTVRQEVESGMGEVMEAQAKLEAVYAAYAEEDADFDKLAEEQARLEAIIATAGSDTEHQMEIAADALRLPPWDAVIGNLSGGEKRRVALCRLLLSAPDMLLLACQQLGLQPAEVLFVGDDERDIAAGRAAGCRTAAVTWGYIHPEDHPSHWGADVIVNHPGELRSVLDNALCGC